MLQVSHHGMALLLLLLQFYLPTPLAAREPETVMQGSWVSCPQDDGDYGEKGYVFRFKGRALFELHMGPRDEFALFAGELEEHVPHSDPSNLLGPSYHFNDIQTVAGGRNWSSAQLGVRVNVVAIPPTREECYSFILLVEKDPALLRAHR
jgi:hypothetical protein